ncbi:MAG TPA: helix-turn-helix domain-containing protein [Vicinamibacterales bacterium]|nr:helix-turn-helix domain-containing protein [Vicinamibacterales bacterium]
MCPRPRKASDDDIYLAAQRAMSRLGPGELTLADIAAEAGVTAGLLVQRFGSKRELLLALSRRFSGGTAAMFAELRKGRRSPLATLRAYSDCMAHMAASPAVFARNFAYLQIDLTDPEFRAGLAAHARAARKELQKLIREAIDAKELLPTTNAKQLARTVEAVVNGSMLSWAFYQEGTAQKWMRRDLDAVLKPYLA